MFIVWTVVNIVLFLLIWPAAVVSIAAEIIVYIIHYVRKKLPSVQPQQPQHWQPKPGSAEDFERWKAEREKQQEEPQ